MRTARYQAFYDNAGMDLGRRTKGGTMEVAVLRSDSPHGPQFFQPILRYVADGLRCGYREIFMGYQQCSVVDSSVYAPCVPS